MENSTTHSQTTNYKEQRERWAHEETLQLTQHFHRLNKNTAEFERVSDFIMNKDGDVLRFETIKKVIKGLRIYLALDASDKEKFTFFPVLEAMTQPGEFHYFKLFAAHTREVNTKTEVVPRLFKDIIGKNWDTIDLNLIDDLFIATKKVPKEFDRIVRVKYYEVSQDIIEKVINNLPEINGITLYSGIDMNKFGDKTSISFTPVLGFQHNAAMEDIEGYGLQGIMEFSKGEVLIEYTRPCPPTC
ncbi:hypothetical protein [uncultured Kordia sp.]|uniref:hypothetical protein n=1 Tax=uncultured Kordia sp. TaxID=507699 RepID=UPI0026053155|nr:hypothetical protein [uncultured Kordia sp.]